MDALTKNGDSIILQTEGALTAKGQLSIPESKRLTVRLGTLWRSIFFVIIVFLLRSLLHDLNGQTDYINDQPQKAEDEGEQCKSLQQIHSTSLPSPSRLREAFTKKVFLPESLLHSM